MTDENEECGKIVGSNNKKISDKVINFMKKLDTRIILILDNDDKKMWI